MSTHVCLLPSVILSQFVQHTACLIEFPTWQTELWSPPHLYRSSHKGVMWEMWNANDGVSSTFKGWSRLGADAVRSIIEFCVFEFPLAWSFRSLLSPLCSYLSLCNTFPCSLSLKGREVFSMEQSGSLWEGVGVCAVTVGPGNRGSFLFSDSVEVWVLRWSALLLLFFCFCFCHWLYDKDGFVWNWSVRFFCAMNLASTEFWIPLWHFAINRIQIGPETLRNKGCICFFISWPVKSRYLIFRKLIVSLSLEVKLNIKCAVIYPQFIFYDLPFLFLKWSNLNS